MLRKNPWLQTAVSVGAGLAVMGGSAAMGVELLIAAGFGAVGFLAASFLLSRTSKEVEKDQEEQSVTEAFAACAGLLSRLAQVLGQMGSHVPRAGRPSFPRSVMQQIGQVIEYGQIILADLKKPGKFSQSKLDELRSYLGDMLEAIAGYFGIVTGELTVSTGQRPQMLATFEQALPDFVRGFRALAENVDESEAMLAAMKASLLRNKMLARGRISDQSSEGSQT